MKKFGIFLCEQTLKENEDNIGPEFEDALKQAQAAYDDGELDVAYEIMSKVEPQSEAESSLKTHFLAMLGDHRYDFTKNHREI